LKAIRHFDPQAEKHPGGEREIDLQKRSAAERTPGMQVVRSIVP